MVTIEESASGMAATASATANHQRIQKRHMAAEHRQKEYAHTYHQDDSGQLFGKIVQAFLQRCSALLCLVH